LLITTIILRACYLGLQGFQGVQGYQGIQGYQGFQGITGPTGSGLQGIQGTIGPSGFQGTQGETGSLPSNYVTTDTQQTISGGKTFSSNIIAPSGLSTNTVAAQNTTLQLQLRGGGAVGGPGTASVRINSSQSFTNTSGESSMFNIIGSIIPTSGSASFHGMIVEPTITQVGATGITRGILIRSNIVSAYDYRALEISGGSGYGIYQSGTASNYFAGPILVPNSLTLGIGTATTLFDGTTNRIYFTGSNPGAQIIGRINLPNVGGYTAGDGINFGVGSMYASANNTITISSTITSVGYLLIANGVAIQNSLNGNRGRINFFNPGIQIDTDFADNTPTLKIRNINASSTGDIIQMRDSNDSPLVVVNRSGNLGIGATGFSQSAKFNILNSSLGTGATDTSGIFLENRTSAATASQQASPAIVLSGNGWALANSGTAMGARIKIDNLPERSTAVPSGSFRVQRSVNGSAYSDLFRVYIPTSSNDTVLSMAGANVFGTGGGVTQFYGSSSGFTFYNSAGSVILLSLNTAGKLTFPTTTTAVGTTGNRTINNPSGIVNFATGSTALTVTNSTVVPNSLIFTTLRTNDATADIKNTVITATGSFTINMGTAPSSEVSVGFLVIN
jgi:hypothetical protein